jgi:hypothetical protein
VSFHDRCFAGGAVSGCASCLPHPGADNPGRTFNNRRFARIVGWPSRTGAFMRQWKAIIGVEADEGMMLLAQ